MVLIPVLLITSFAIASICYLKRINERKIKSIRPSDDRGSGLFSGCCYCCFRTKKRQESQRVDPKKSTANSYCCCPSTEMNPHALMQTFDESDTISEKPRSGGSTRMKKTHSHLNGATNSLGSSLSDSSSTTATTVAYYAAMPLLIDNNNNAASSPPPLPNSQPPAFSSNSSSPNYNTENFVHQKTNLERTISTPSMAYYKIVDCELANCGESKPSQKSKRLDFDLEDAEAGVSTNSQFYYQLSPTMAKR